jgi:hypothetical protein
MLLHNIVIVSTGDEPFSSGLVHFLAVLGIDTNTHRLRTAKNYLYMLAGVVYGMRVLGAEQMDKDPERFLQHRKKYPADSS